MKLRLLILLAAALAASPAAGQTIKSLGYNTTNGQVVYSGTNTLRMPDQVKFGTNSAGVSSGGQFFTLLDGGGGVAMQLGTNLITVYDAIDFGGVSATALSNAATTRTNFGLGGTNTVTFSNIQLNSFPGGGSGGFVGRNNTQLSLYGTNVTSSVPAFYGWDGFNNAAMSAGTSRTNLGLGATNSVTFSNITANGTLAVSNAATFATNVTVNGNISVGSLTTTTPSTWALDATQTAAATNGVLALPSNANVIRLTNNNAISGVSGGVLGAFYYLVNQTTNAVTISNVGGITVDGAQNLTLSPNESATLVATGSTNASVAARGDLTDVALGGTANTAPSQTASSGASLMTRDLSDARYSPMPMTPQIVPWFYDGTLGITRTTNGSASFGTSPAYPSLSTTTNAADSAIMVVQGDAWGAVDTAANPFNQAGRTVVLQGRLWPQRTNAVARFVWSSSTNWPTVMTNLGTNGISNLGWAVETDSPASGPQVRLIVNGATNKSESAWTALGFAASNDENIMVVSSAGSTRLYVTSGGSAFSRTPLITVSNQIGGSASGAFQGGLGVSLVNTGVAGANPNINIRRAYQALGMTNYGY